MKKYSSKNKSLYLSLVFLSATQSVFSLPQGAVTGADVAISQDQNTMVINQTGERSVINWSSFNIGEKELVQFSQPSTSSAVLNRDLGGLPSQILGSLVANGQVYLINQSGIIFGENAIVNAAAFFASTLDVLNDKFMHGENLLFEGEASGEIVHLGKISAELGDVMLIGRQIRSEGVIEAKNGTIGMGAGVEVLVQPKMGEKIYIQAAREMAKEDGTAIDVKGTLTALQVELKADGNLYQMGIKNAARVEAMRSVERDGKIFLVAENGLVDVGGELIAPGGEIRVLGERLQLNETGLIDVSSETLGGTVLFGGDFQGKNAEVMNAEVTVIGKGAAIKADALENGDGGKVIIWADGGTGYYGNISAQGGPYGGDGGFVEVSGKKHLEYLGFVSTLAPMGETGNLLLDPVNVTISSAANASVNVVTYVPTACSPAPNVNNAALVGSWFANNVAVITTSPPGPDCGQPGNITVLDDVILLVESQFSLTLVADNNIFIAARIVNPQIAVFPLSTINVGATNSVYIGSSAIGVPATKKSGIGTSNGMNMISAQYGVVEIGNPMGAFASQVGFPDTPPGGFGVPYQGNISIFAAGDISVLGGSGGNRAYAQIGHGFIDPTPSVSNEIQGVINTSGGNTTISLQSNNGGVNVLGGQNGIDNYAQIGHGGINVGNETNNITGDINITCPGLVTVKGGQGAAGSTDILCYAQIGHGGGSDFTSVVNSNGITGQINMASGVTPAGFVVQGGTTTRSWAHIGHGGDNCTINETIGNPATISLTTNVSDLGVTVAGGTGRSAWAMIGHGGGAETFIGGGLGNTVMTAGSILGDINIIMSGGNLKVMGVQDPTLVTPAQGSFAQIGHGGLGTIVSSLLGMGGPGFGDWAGDITITNTSPLSNIVVTAGNGLNDYAQIGHGGAFCSPDAIGSFAAPALTTDISVLGGTITVSGTTGPGLIDQGMNAYGMIGHGGAGCNITANITDANLGMLPNSGQISGNFGVLATSLTVNPSLILSGATISPASGSQNAIGQIGHGGFGIILNRPAGSTMNPAWQLSGTISVGGSRGVTLNAGLDQLDGGAWIGHGSVEAGNGNPMTIVGDIFVTVSSSAPNTGNIILNGGAATSSFAKAVIGNGNLQQNSHVTFTGSNQTIQAMFGNIMLNGGAGDDAQAAIVQLSTTAGTGTQLIAAIPTGGMSGIVSLIGGSGVNSSAIISAQGASQTISTASFSALGGSATPSFAFVDFANSAGTTSITASRGDIVFFNGTSATANPAMLSSSVFPTASSGAAISLTAAGDIVLANSVTSSNAAGMTFTANSASSGFGAFKVDTSTHTPAGVQIAPGTNGINLATFPVGNITMTNAPFLNGYSNAPADFQLGNITDLSLIGSGLMPALIDALGNLNIDAYRNVFITSGISGAGGTLQIIANNNMSLSGGAHLTGDAGVTLVCDNQAPSAASVPPIGPGTFTMAAGTSITSSSSPLRIFTARRGQDSILGTLNGLPFVPGPLFVNSATEQWQCYFGTPCASTGGTPFTIFYKDFFVPTPPPIPVPPFSPQTAAAAQTISTTVLSQILFNATDWDSYLFWELVFDINYDREPYLAGAQDMEKIKSFFKYLKPYEKSGLFEGLMSGMGAQKSVSSYDVVPNRQMTLPALWKADSKQYPSVIY